jgi:protein TonB
MTELWLTDVLMTEPLSGAAICYKEIEPALEFVDEPSDGCLSLYRLKRISIFSDSRTWSSLAMVVFFHVALALMLLYCPKPAVQNDKWMEVQLVSFQGDPNTAGPSVRGSVETESSEGPNDAARSVEPETHQETLPLQSETVPPEMKKEVPPQVPVKKNVQPARPQHKEKIVTAQAHSADSQPLAHSDAPAESSGQIAGSATGAESSAIGAPSPGGAVESGSRGPVERAFGTPDGPSFLRRVVPSYPVLAKRLEKQGTVLLRVTIDESGRPVKIEVLEKGGFGFDEEAVKAVKDSTFVPAKKDGKPLTCKALLPIRFVLKES